MLHWGKNSSQKELQVVGRFQSFRSSASLFRTLVMLMQSHWELVVFRVLSASSFIILFCSSFSFLILFSFRSVFKKRVLEIFFFISIVLILYFYVYVFFFIYTGLLEAFIIILLFFFLCFTISSYVLFRCLTQINLKKLMCE